MTTTQISGAYVSFATLKRSGDWVSTPVWYAPLDGTYYIFSAEDAGKVKRLRNFDTIKAANCTVSGKVIGDSHSGHATLLSDQSDIDKAYEALYTKYGWQMRLTDWMSKLAGKINKRTLIAFTLDD